MTAIDPARDDLRSTAATAAGPLLERVGPPLVGTADRYGFDCVYAGDRHGAHEWMFVAPTVDDVDTYVAVSVWWSATELVVASSTGVAVGARYTRELVSREVLPLAGLDVDDPAWLHPFEAACTRARELEAAVRVALDQGAPLPLVSTYLPRVVVRPAVVDLT